MQADVSHIRFVELAAQPLDALICVHMYPVYFVTYVPGLYPVSEKTGHGVRFPDTPV